LKAIVFPKNLSQSLISRQISALGSFSVLSTLVHHTKSEPYHLTRIMKYFSFATLSLALSLWSTEMTTNVMADHPASEGSDLDWTHMDDMPVARSDLTATLVSVGGDDKIFLFGGCAAHQVKVRKD